MTHIGITGHRGLTGPVTAWVRQALREFLGAEQEPPTGVTCLADGADQLFAQAVLDVGASLHVIVPARAYRAGLPSECHRAYDEFLAAATRVERLDFEDSDERAHMAASVLMLDRIDRLVAVWDGLPARGHGGTADVVDLARTRAIPVAVLWPPGATRD